MTHRTISVDVDLAEFSDKILVDEMKSRGYNILNGDNISREEVRLLLNLLDNCDSMLYIKSLLREKLLELNLA